jgi:hypothetical protein
MTDSRDTILDADIEQRSEIGTPVLYSQAAIFGFSFFFSTIAGGIMMSMNLSRLRKPGIVPVLAFGIGYPVAMAVFDSFVELPRAINTAMNIGAAYVMKEFIWNKFIGKETVYTKRPIWIPLAICLVIAAVLVALIIYSDNIL